jgi:hypothetical protein
LLNILYSVVKEQMHSSREPCTILRAQKACQGTLCQNLWPGIPRTACPHRTFARGQKQEAQVPSGGLEDNKATDGSQVDLCV